MQQSVLSPSVVQATFAATLFDEWVRCGLRDVVVCPGSRSTPLALAASARPELTLHVRIDERSAGFFALGRAIATGLPVAIVVTSGTAAVELHPCVAEADLARVPVLVVTADRPPELRGVGAPQTIDQRNLYGAMVRAFCDPGVPVTEGRATWRVLARELWATSAGAEGRAGPVHLNAAFVEPLIARAEGLPDVLEQVEEAPVAHADADLDLDGLRVLAVVGHGVARETVEHCKALNWVVLGDATALGSTAYFDAILRSSSFVEAARPDVVVRMGGLPASKVLQEQLRRWNVRTVGLDGAGFIADPERTIKEVIPGLPRPDVSTMKADPAYAEQWRNASTKVGEWLSDVDRYEELLNEPLVARTVVEASARTGVALVVGSSMPVRDVEWWTPSRTAPTYSNRGVNGIDGVVSTVFGVAAGSRALGLVGDITMLHDVSGLVEGVGGAGGSCVLVVVDNDGGGIFSFLSQATSLSAEPFEKLFGTPRHHDLAAIAGAFGHAARNVNTRDELRDALDTGLAMNGVSVVVAKVPSREQNVQLHEAWNDKVRSLLGMV